MLYQKDANSIFYGDLLRASTSIGREHITSMDERARDKSKNNRIFALVGICILLSFYGLHLLIDSSYPSLIEEEGGWH